MRTLASSAGRLLALAALVVMALSCDKGSPTSPAATAPTTSTPTPTPTPTAPTPAAIVIVSGDLQTAATGGQFVQPIVAKVTTASNAALSGITVTFQVASGSGSVSPGTAVTDANGLAQTTVNAGGSAGQLVVTASVATLTQKATVNLTVASQTQTGGAAQRWVGTTSQNRAITLWVLPGSVIDSLRVDINVSIVSGMSSCTVTFTPTAITLAANGSFTAALTSTTQVTGTLSGSISSSTASGTYTAGWSGIIMCGSSLTIGTGGNTSTGTWTATKSPLAVSSVSPSGGPLAGGSSVTINGWFESSVDSVRMGTARVTNLVRVSSTRLTGTTPPGSTATSVNVTAYAGTASATCSSCFTYGAPSTVSGVSPNSGSSAGGRPVTITGTNFPYTVDSVRFGTGRLASVSRVSSTQLTGITPAAAATGAVDVTVFSTSAGSATCAGCYTYTTPAPPLVWASLAAGEYFTCGLTSAGVAYCWGENYYGELGDGTTTPHSAPTAVAGGRTFTKLVAAKYHACGLTSGGAAYCWGYNSRGQIGDGTTFSRSVQTAVSGGLTFASLTTGGDHTCAVTSAGVAYCWGGNSSSELGDGTTINRYAPVVVSGGLSFASVTGGIDHSCAATGAGVAYCWGYNLWGQVGDNSTTRRSAPAAVSGGLNFATLDAGDSRTCGLTSA